MNTRRRRPLHAALVWLGLVVTIVFGYLAVRDVHAGEVWDALEASNPWWLLPAFAMLAVAVALRAVRWRSLFRPETRPPLRPVASALLVGYLFNNILPARAGEAARVVALNRRTQGSRPEAIATIVVERAYDVLVLLVLLFCASPWLPDVSWLGAATVLAAVLAIVVAATIVTVVRYGTRPLRFVLRPLTRLVPEQRVVRAADSVIRGLAGLHNPAVALAGLIWTLLSWLALAVSSWLLLEGFDVGLSTRDAALAGLLAVIATNLAMILPASPAAVGVFEAATVAALGAFGVGDSAALSYALVLHALNFFPYLIVGAIVLRRYTGRPVTVHSA